MSKQVINGFDVTKNYVNSVCRNCEHCFILVNEVNGWEKYWCNKKIPNGDKKSFGEIENLDWEYCKGKQFEERTLPALKELVKIKIELPRAGRLISKFADQVAKVYKHKSIFFYRPELKEIVEVRLLKSKNDNDEFLGFSTINPARFITMCEKHFQPVVINKGNSHDIPWEKITQKSMGSDLSNIILQSPHLQDNLPIIKRIFSIPLPIIHRGKLTFPKRGYDKRFNSWLNHNSPEITKPDMELKEAKKIIYKIFKEFCFQNKQDYTNAIAALITPFLRGLFSSFTKRTPIFFYIANRERAGKDYLAGITGLIYEGKVMEEPPISCGERSGSNNSEELRKKILSAFIAGRKRLHFANNKGYINNATFEQVVTSEHYEDRALGRNELLSFNNEMDFSLSGNVGIGFTPDFAFRSIFIRLLLNIENANERKFKKPNLHGWVLKNREIIISAIYTLVKNWYDKGCKKGTVPFASFNEWSEICGGIMEEAGYTNPCVVDKETLLVGGDTGTNDMKELFKLCYDSFPEEWISKQQVRKLLIEEGVDIFTYLDFNERKSQTKFGKDLTKYYGRILGNITLIVRDVSVRSSRQEVKFTQEKCVQNKKEIFGKEFDKNLK